ncbi:MAG TPA: hypothetical protein VGQ57_09435 [Polyangiaceae bacterium]|nr:hypothetical protein [Polyangiaceae bacterium]
MSIPKRFFGPAQLNASPATTKYTVPATRIAVIRNIHVYNPTGSAVTFTMSIGADAAGTRIFDAFSVPANSVYDSFAPFVLAAGELVQAFAGTANVLTLTLDGEEDLTG